MTYGIEFENVSKVNHPRIRKTLYGHKIDAISKPEFCLKRFYLMSGKELSFRRINNTILFLEKGRLLAKPHKSEIYLPLKYNLTDGDVLSLPSHISHLSAEEDSVFYLFSDNQTADKTEMLRAQKTFDIREKYWGSIESIISDETLSAKRIFMNKGKQSSLEYHLQKKEAYFLNSGKLKVGLRVGRAENRSVVLNAGDSYVIPPGLMHMRIALEDSVIMEIATKDDDKDSHIVEDGQTYEHKEIDS
ncbi:MAG: cupin domain-containing protein [Nanoarchaeota archaeon]